MFRFTGTEAHFFHARELGIGITQANINSLFAWREDFCTVWVYTFGSNKANGTCADHASFCVSHCRFQHFAGPAAYKHQQNQPLNLQTSFEILHAATSGR